MKRQNEAAGPSLRRLLSNLVFLSWLLAGCGASDAQKQTAVQEQQELEQLRQAKQEAEKLRAENREAVRLRRDNEEIKKLKSVPEEMAKLRQENDQLRLQVTQAQQAKAQIRVANPQANNPAPAPGGVTPPPVIAPGGIGPADIPLSGDEIFLDPRQLSKILPQFNWETLERKEPIGVKALLEQQGIVITNYNQLRALGLTNYSIRRIIPPSPPPGQ